MEPFEWVCPYCDRPQTVTENNYDSSELRLHETRKSKYGLLVIDYVSIVCLNNSCKEVILTTRLSRIKINSQNGSILARTPVEIWKLRPAASSKIFPSYIPSPLINDYVEACKIRDLSPKASATLARRCIQGMIRDFCGISKNRLIDEVNELRDLSNQDKLPKGVLAEHIEAIDLVRGVGNIGAHFEKDINIIIDVESDEAEQFIGLIELLFQEWYVARADRIARFEKLKSISADKAALKEQSKKTANKA